MDIVTRTLLAMEMSQHRAGLYAPCYGVFGGAGLAQLYEATEDQKERFLYPTLRGEKRGFFGLTEPSGGSDPARAIQTRAVRDGNGWIINGSKIFISRRGPCPVRHRVRAHLTGQGTQRHHLFHRRDRHAGLPRAPGGAHAALIPLRHRARVQGPARARENVLGEVDRGFAIASDRLSRQRIPYAAGCIGVAMKAQELAVEYANLRETFGARLATRQTIQNMLVDNEVEIESARWLTLAAAHRAHRGEPFKKEAAMAKLVAAESGYRVVDRCLQIHGGYGVTKDFPFERWLREMRIRRVGEGPSEVQRLIVARELLGANLK